MPTQSPIVLSAVTAALLINASANAGSFAITYEEPGVMSANPILMKNANAWGVEDFNKSTKGNIGTDFGTNNRIRGEYVGGIILKNADKYGGAGGAGQYVFTNNTKGYTLNLSTNGVPGVNYFGFWLSALDEYSQLEFYQDDTLVGSYNPPDLINDLKACNAGGKHCGNPNKNISDRNGSQQYAFVNFYYSGGYFNKVKFYMSENKGGYESDNHTVAYCKDIESCKTGKTVSTSVVSSCVDNLKELAHWSFEGNVNDVSGSGYHGAVKGGATYTSGYMGQGLSLDGRTGFIGVNKAIPASYFSAGDYTISGAFKSNGNGKNAQDILSAVNDKDKHGILIELGVDGRIRFVHRMPFSNDPSVGVSLFSMAGKNLNDGQFHTFSAVTNAGKVELFVDGESQAKADEKSEFNQDVNVVIGKLLPNENHRYRYFNGVLDEIKIYNGATNCNSNPKDDASGKVPEFSNMMTAAVNGKVVPSDNAYFLYRTGDGADIKQGATPTKLVMKKQDGGKVSFQTDTTPTEYVSIMDITDTGCHSHVVKFTKDASKKAEFFVRNPKMKQCPDNADFCVKPEDLFVSYEYAAEPGYYLRHCGYKIGLKEVSQKPGNVEIGDMTWRMQPAK